MCACVYDSGVLAVLQWLANQGSPLALPMRGRQIQLCHAETTLVILNEVKNLAALRGVYPGCNEWAQGDNAGHTKSKKVQSTVKLYSILKQNAILKLCSNI